MSVLLGLEVPNCEGEPRARHQQCPYLERARETSWYPIDGYCLAWEEGGLRVVTIAEFHELCTTVQYVRCELYRKRLGQDPAEPNRQDTGETT